MPDLAGKVAIITGGASGIGRAGTVAFAAAGATVVLADINHEGGGKVAQEIGGGAVFEPVDVRDSQQVQRLVANTVARFGRVDALFHNAMNVPLVNRGDGRATELPEETWHEIVESINSSSVVSRRHDGPVTLMMPRGRSWKYRGTEA